MDKSINKKQCNCCKALKKAVQSKKPLRTPHDNAYAHVLFHRDTLYKGYALAVLTISS